VGSIASNSNPYNENLLLAFTKNIFVQVVSKQISQIISIRETPAAERVVRALLSPHEKERGAGLVLPAHHEIRAELRKLRAVPLEKVLDLAKAVEYFKNQINDKRIDHERNT